MDPYHTVGQKSSSLDHVFAALSVRQIARQQGAELSFLFQAVRKRSDRQRSH